MKLQELHEQLDIQNLKSQGFNIDMILYHGTDKNFDKFDKKFNITAAHIYTSPDIETAKAYGKNIHKIIPRIKKFADLADDYKLILTIANEIKDNFEDKSSFSPEELVNDDVISYKIKELCQDLIQYKSRFSDDEWENDISYNKKEAIIIDLLSFHNAVEFLAHGNYYRYDSKGRFQDHIMNICFDLGYNCVKFHDHSSTGESVSYVFNDPEDLFILL